MNRAGLFISPTLFQRTLERRLSTIASKPGRALAVFPLRSKNDIGPHPGPAKSGAQGRTPDKTPDCAPQATRSRVKAAWPSGVSGYPSTSVFHTNGGPILAEGYEYSAMNTGRFNSRCTAIIAEYSYPSAKMGPPFVW